MLMCLFTVICAKAVSNRVMHQSHCILQSPDPLSCVAVYVCVCVCVCACVRVHLCVCVLL